MRNALTAEQKATLTRNVQSLVKDYGCIALLDAIAAEMDRLGMWRVGRKVQHVVDWARKIPWGGDNL